MMPTVAVIVPVYQEAEILCRRLSQLKALPADEVIFVDGGSHDETPALIRAAGLPLLTAAKGRANQMNAGAAASNADWLLFLHADTILSPEALAAMRAATCRPQCIGGRFDVQLDHPAMVFRLISLMINWRSRLSTIATGDQAIFVRRDVFVACGGFPPLPLMEDVAFSRSLKHYAREHQAWIACLPQRVTTSARRWQRHGIGRTILLMWKLRLLFWLGVDTEKLAALYRDAR